MNKTKSLDLMNIKRGRQKINNNYNKQAKYISEVNRCYDKGNDKEENSKVDVGARVGGIGLQFLLG